MEHKQKLDIMKRRHEIFVGLSKKDVVLVSADPPGRTDAQTYIAVPIEDPDVLIIHRHEWQHVFWKSNIHARRNFVIAYVQRLNAMGIGLDGPLGEEAEEVVDLFCNALDDIRVNSLDRLIYPGSAADVDERWRRLIMSSRGSSFALRLIGLGAGLTAEETPGPTKFDHLLLEAIRRVQGRGFSAVLLTARWLLDAIVLEVLPQGSPELPEESRLPAPAAYRKLYHPNSGGIDKYKAKRNMGSLGISLKTAKVILDTREPPPLDEDPQRTLEASRTALEPLDHDAMMTHLDASEGEVRVVMSMLASAGEREPNTDRELLSDLGKVEFRNLGPADVEPLILPFEDQRLVAEMRRHFSQLHEARRRRHGDAGSLDAGRYVDYQMGQGDQDYFIDEKLGRGFKMLVLGDMSGSMGTRWHTLARAVKVAAEALDFPFSEIETWSFSGAHTGETVIFRYEDPHIGFMPATHHKEAWGLTPLHIAVPIAVRRLRQMKGGTKHLLIVTDGMPQNVTPIPTAQLMNAVAKAVQDAGAAGIVVSALIIGSHVSTEDAFKMFANKWKRVPDTQADLFYDMTALVRATFSMYLRS